MVERRELSYIFSMRTGMLTCHCVEVDDQLSSAFSSTLILPEPSATGAVARFVWLLSCHFDGVQHTALWCAERASWRLEVGPAAG